TDSGEYEYESLSEATTEKDIDQIHVFENLLEVGETSGVMFDKFRSTNVLASSVDDVSSLRNSNAPMDEIALGLDLLVHAFDDNTVNALEPATTLSLTHPELIDWNSTTTNEVLTFQNDYALAFYLNVVEPVTSSTSEHSVNMTEADIKYLSHKIKKKKNRRSDAENHIVAV
ncbi:hypothetical protein, partial [Pseudomonas laurentiana]|uniref:hypothetical protein n=1 Tax=Pseudomonas laurentiana TaxID=2364649 RepID=UPI001E575BD7